MPDRATRRQRQLAADRRGRERDAGGIGNRCVTAARRRQRERRETVAAVGQHDGAAIRRGVQPRGMDGAALRDARRIDQSQRAADRRPRHFHRDRIRHAGIATGRNAQRREGIARIVQHDVAAVRGGGKAPGRDRAALPDAAARDQRHQAAGRRGADRNRRRVSEADGARRAEHLRARHRVRCVRQNNVARSRGGRQARAL